MGLRYSQFLSKIREFFTSVVCTMNRIIDTARILRSLPVLFSFGIVSLAHANDIDISPAHNSVSEIAVGESVFGSCRLTNRTETVCRIDCGNGQMYEARSGICLYTQAGEYKLVVERVVRRRAHKHVITVNVSATERVAKKRNSARRFITAVPGMAAPATQVHLPGAINATTQKVLQEEVIPARDVVQAAQTVQSTPVAQNYSFNEAVSEIDQQNNQVSAGNSESINLTDKASANNSNVSINRTIFVSH